MSRRLHHGVLLLLLAMAGLSGERASAAEEVQTNRSLSIPARPTPQPAAQPNADTAANDPAAAEPSAQASPSSVPSDASSEASRNGAAQDDTAAPSAPSSPDASTLPARERLPLGPTNASSGDREDLAADGSDRSWILQTLAALGVVIALILLLRAFLQRLGGAPAGSTNSGLVEVVARTGIGPRTQVLFLRINQRIIVVAQSSSGLQTLTELDDPEEVAWLLGRVESAKPMSISQGFRHLMHRAERDYNRAEMAASEDGGDEQEQYVDRTRSQLSGLLSHIRTLKQRAP